MLKCEFWVNLFNKKKKKNVQITKKLLEEGGVFKFKPVKLLFTLIGLLVRLLNSLLVLLVELRLFS